MKETPGKVYYMIKAECGSCKKRNEFVYNVKGCQCVVLVGQVLPSASKYVEGFIECNGQSLSKVRYAKLFEAIGSNYGDTGDKFKIPNLK